MYRTPEPRDRTRSKEAKRISIVRKQQRAARQKG